MNFMGPNQLLRDFGYDTRSAKLSPSITTARCTVSFEEYPGTRESIRMITVTVILQADPARLDYFLECIREQAAGSNTEPGCRRFVVSQQLDNPAIFTFQEEFVDEAALKAHYETPHFARWKEKTGDGLIVTRTSSRGKIVAG